MLTHYPTVQNAQTGQLEYYFKCARERVQLRCRQGRLCRLRLRLFPQDRRGNQRDGEPNRERLDERHRCVEERVVFYLLVFFYLLYLRLDGGRARARGLELLDHMGAVFVHEIGQEVEVENFPRHDVEDARNQGNGDPDGKSFLERDLAAADVVAARADAEEYQQEREHDGRVADDQALV